MHLQIMYWSEEKSECKLEKRVKLHKNKNTMCERKCYQSPIKYAQNTPTPACMSEKDECWK